jgi:integrase/recombinase XerD
MGSSQPPGPALVAAAADADPVTLLVLAWLSAKRSENTRAAYARDIGITPQRRPSRAPSWLAWCQQQQVHPVTGVTGLHAARYARQLDHTRLSPASAARKLAAISSWYAWLARRGHITASPAAGIARPRPGPHTPAPALTPRQALALMDAADTAPGPQRARTAALTAVLLLTDARLSEVTGADVADLGTSGGRRVLWVTRANGRRRGLPLPGPAASRIDAYLAARASQADDQALFATRTGKRLFAADVRRALRRLATRAGLPADQSRQLGPRTIRQSLTKLYLQAGAPPAFTAARGMPHAARHTRPRLSPRSSTPRGPGSAPTQVAPAQAPPSPPGPRRRSQTPRAIGASTGKHAVLMVLAAMFALPLVWMVGTSFKTAQQALQLPVVWWPHPFLWSNYPDLFAALPYFRFFLNTFLYAGITIVGVCVSSSLVAYGFSRLRWPGRDALFYVMLMTLIAGPAAGGRGVTAPPPHHCHLKSHESGPGAAGRTIIGEY